MAHAVIYARLSDTRGEVDGIERQVREARAHAKKLGVQVVETLIDNDISAAKKKRRPAFEQLMAGIAADEWDVVILRSLDRWVRRPAELERIIEVVEKSKVKVEAIHGEIDLRTRGGRLQARVVTAVAMAEVEATRERVTDWHADKAARGIKVGKPGFGFQRVEAKTVANPEEAELIRDAATRALANEPLNAIARSWNEQGLGGREWTGRFIKRILVNPRTAGLREHNGKLTEGDWAPILDRVTWERLRALLNDPSRRTQVSTAARLLTGIASCGKCRGPLNSAPYLGVPRYACKACWGVTVRVAHIEPLVLERLFARVEENPRVGRASKGVTVDEERVSAEIQTVEHDLRTLAAELGDGTITMDEYKIARAGMADRLKALRKQLDVPAPKPYAGDSTSLIRDWDGMAVKQQRQILSAWAADVEVKPSRPGGPPVFNPERVFIHWR